VAGVDQADLESAVFEDLEQRDPVDPGSLHRDGGDAAFGEPIGQLIEVSGEGAEMAHRLRVTIRGHRHVVDGGTEIDAGGFGVGSLRGGIAFFLRVRVLFLLAMGVWSDWVELAHPDHDGPEGEKHEYSLIRGRHGQKPGTPPMTSRTASGAKLLDGLEIKHHCNVGVSLPRGRMPRQHEGPTIHPQGSFIHVFPRPWPGGGLLGDCFFKLVGDCFFNPNARSPRIAPGRRGCSTDESEVHGLGEVRSENREGEEEVSGCFGSGSHFGTG